MPPAKSGRTRATAVLTLSGEIAVTLGAIVLLFAVWQCWWSNVVGAAQARHGVETLQVQFAARSVQERQQWATGEAFAILRIPRFGADYAEPIIEGTSSDELSRGVGHYEETAMPGEVGNFALAGHRNFYGQPFNRIAELRPDDPILVQTQLGWYLYRVTDHEIVEPSDGEVLAAVPDHPGATPRSEMLTLTSCHPQYSVLQRYIVFARLEGRYRTADALPAGILDGAKR